MKPEASIIENLASQIVEAVHPMSIILFGSAARGEMGPGSDIDLMIIMPDGTDCGKTTQRLYNRVGGVNAGYDLVVATPGILEKYKDNCALVYKWALKEGQVVYAA